MFKIIGVDGKEYGPVTADQIRAWIKEGRCNASTQVQGEGATEWLSLAQVPEFMSEFAAPAATQNPLPQGEVALTPEALLARPIQFDIFDCLGRGWHLVMGHFWLSLGVTLVAIIVSGVPVVGLVIMPGWIRFFLRLRRGEQARFEDLFAAFSDRFVATLLAVLVAALLSAVGFFLCIIPGIYLGVAWYFAGPAALETKLDFWPAMELSRKVVTAHWFSIFCLAILVGLLQMAGFIACVVGIFVTMAWGVAAFACAYYSLFEEGVPGTPAAPSSTVAVVAP